MASREAVKETACPKRLGIMDFRFLLLILLTYCLTSCKSMTWVKGQRSPTAAPPEEVEPSTQKKDENDPASKTSETVPRIVPNQPSAQAPIASEQALHHIITIGQSNSVGGGSAGLGPLPTSFPHRNLKMMGPIGVQWIEPLSEPVTGPQWQNNLIRDANNRGAETPLSGAANLISSYALKANPPVDYQIIMSLSGVGGADYEFLKKGSKDEKYRTHEHSLESVQKAMAFAKSFNRDYKVTGIFVIHGEADAQEGTQNYDDLLIEWRKTYEQDIKAITGQTEPIKFFLSQMSGSLPRIDGSPLQESDIKNWATIREAQYRATLRDPNIILAGPGYQFPSRSDVIHYNAVGSRALGELLGKVYSKVQLEGHRWEPLSPKTIARNLNEIVIDFNVPVPPLVLSDKPENISSTWGFEYHDDQGTIGIESVRFSSDTSVAIKLTGDPSNNTGRKLRYGYHPSETLLRGGGILCDSDKSESLWKNDLRNYSIYFERDVN